MVTLLTKLKGASLETRPAIGARTRNTGKMKSRQQQTRKKSQYEDLTRRGVTISRPWSPLRPLSPERTNGRKFNLSFFFFKNKTKSFNDVLLSPKMEEKEKKRTDLYESRRLSFNDDWRRRLLIYFLSGDTIEKEREFYGARREGAIIVRKRENKQYLAGCWHWEGRQETGNSNDWRVSSSSWRCCCSHRRLPSLTNNRFFFFFFF